MRLRSAVIGVLLGLLFSQNSWAVELMCDHVVPIQQRFLARHVTYTKFTKEIEDRTIDQFIKHLDPSKVYFYASDIATIKKQMSGIFEKTKKSDCSAIIEAQKILVNRVRENVEFAKAMMKAELKIDPKTSLTMDSKKRAFAKDKKESEDFEKKYLQFQLANYSDAGDQESVARQRLVKGYDKVLRRVEQDKEKDVLVSYLDSFSTALDPHSTYWSKDEYEGFETQMKLSFEGIGATLSSKDGFTTIEELVPGGAAVRSGLLKSKDVILGVAQDKGEFEDVIDMDLSDVVKKIKGPKGTRVRLKIMRKGDGGSSRFEVALIRDKIKLEDQAAAVHYIKSEIGGKEMTLALINLPSFYADAANEERSAAQDMKRLLAEVRAKKADGVVLDLAFNGGGVLPDAVAIAGLFFREGNVVKQSTRDFFRPEALLTDSDSSVDWAGPLVVLTNRYSASASEIVAGTLQDYRRAVIVGADHTFGKGTVQTVEEMPKQLGAIKTTMGHYFIPGGNSTQQIGIMSDIVFPSALAVEETGEKLMDYSLPPKKVKPFLSIEAFVPPGQAGAWQMIDKKVVAKLKAASEARIKSDADFKKVFEDIKKIKSLKKGEVVLGDYLKEKLDSDKEQKKTDGKTYEESKAIRTENYLKRADIKESLRVLADLIAVQKGGKTGKITLGISTGNKIEKPGKNSPTSEM
jgi:carboxyl-terminal processing protease